MSEAKKKYTWAIKLFISFFLMAKLFTFLHWPYVQYLSFFSAVVIILFYPFRYAAKPNKILLDHVKMAWVLSFSVQTLFQLQNYFPLTVFQTILFLYWFLNEGFFYFDINLKLRPRKEKEQNILDDFSEEKAINKNSFIIDLVLVLSVVLVLVSALFKITHWPFANEMMIIGYSAFAIVIWFKKF